MTTATGRPRTRLSPEHRRAEIVTAAAEVALREGLECITLRRVAAAVHVRPGLISHYFSEVDALVAAAFAHATNGESQILFPADDTRSVDRRVVTLLDGVLSPDAADFSRLWMSARIVSRHNAALRAVVTAQEETNRHQLIQLIRAGVEGGTFACTTIERSALLIFILLDATTTYVNKDVTEVTDLVGTLLFDTTERELGVPAGTLRSLSAQLAPAGLAATTSP